MHVKITIREHTLRLNFQIAEEGKKMERKKNLKARKFLKGKKNRDKG